MITGKQRELGEEMQEIGSPKISSQVFTFRQMAAATNNFSPECLVGEGGFGRVYKGYIPGVNQVCFHFQVSQPTKITA